jgi:hypothetical protein
MSDEQKNESADEALPDEDLDQVAGGMLEDPFLGIGGNGGNGGSGAWPVGSGGNGGNGGAG